MALDPPHHAGLLQDGQVAVGGALGRHPTAGHDLADRHRSPGVGQHLDKGPAPGRVALVDAAQTSGDGGVEVIHVRNDNSGLK